jgi:hypothetical protein
MPSFFFAWEMEDSMPEQPPKLVMRLTIGVEGHPFVPVGPRFRRGDPMPMEAHYEKHHGYHFDPKDYNTAFECWMELQAYIDKHHGRKPVQDKKPTAKLVGETPAKVSKSVRRRAH